MLRLSTKGRYGDEPSPLRRRRSVRPADRAPVRLRPGGHRIRQPAEDGRAIHPERFFCLQSHVQVSGTPRSIERKGVKEARTCYNSFTFPKT